MLPGLIARVGGKKVKFPTKTYLSNGSGSTSATIRTWSLTVPSGKARTLIVATGAQYSAARAISSITWGSYTGSLLAVGSDSFGNVAFYKFDLPALASNTTNTLTVTWSGATLRGYYAAWTVEDLKSTSLLTYATSTTVPSDLSLHSLTKGAVVLAMGAGYRSSAYTDAWTGPTALFDAVIGSTTARFTAADAQIAAAGDLAITLTPSATPSPYAACAIALR